MTDPRSLRFPAAIRALMLALPLLAGACSSTGSYPSLAIRDVERMQGRATPVEGETPEPEAPLPPADTDLLGRIDSLLERARKADERFGAARENAEGAVSRAGPRPSTSWSTASVALAELEVSRSNAMVALADLDVLYADARDAAPLEESPAAKAIGTAREEVAGIIAGQDAIIERLVSRL